MVVILELLFGLLLVEEGVEYSAHKQHEHAQRHDQEVDDGVEEGTDADADIADLNRSVEKSALKNRPMRGEMMSSVINEFTMAVNAGRRPRRPYPARCRAWRTL